MCVMYNGTIGVLNLVMICYLICLLGVSFLPMISVFFLLLLGASLRTVLAYVEFNALRNHYSKGLSVCVLLQAANALIACLSILLLGLLSPVTWLVPCLDILAAVAIAWAAQSMRTPRVNCGPRVVLLAPSAMTMTGA